MRKSLEIFLNWASSAYCVPWIGLTILTKDSEADGLVASGAGDA